MTAVFFLILESGLISIGTNLLKSISGIVGIRLPKESIPGEDIPSIVFLTYFCTSSFVIRPFLPDPFNLLKDKKTGALLSVDSRGLAARKVLIKKQQEQKKDKEELNSIKEQVDDIQNEMSEIKDLLKAILQK